MRLLGIVAIVDIMAIIVVAVGLVDIGILSSVGSSGISAVLAVDILLSTVVAIDVGGLAYAPVTIAIVDRLGIITVIGVVGVIVAIVNIDGVIGIEAAFDSGFALVDIYFGTLVNIFAVVNGFTFAFIDIDALFLYALVNADALVLADSELSEAHLIYANLLHVNWACKSHAANHNCAAEETCAQNFSELFHCHCKISPNLNYNY